jgi:DEAD/DEAH box helicase domain-containing protein
VEEFPEILEIFEQKEIFGINLRYCSLNIFKKVIGYSNIEIGKEINQGKKVFLNEPITYSYSTKGFIFRVPRPIEILEMVSEKEKVEMSGYHATEHVVIEGSSMLIGGASQDIGGISLGDTGMIVIHDGSIGGNGASKSLFDKFELAIRRAHTILMECPCENDDGCPRCTYSYRCGNNNEYLHKKAAIEVLTRIINREKTVLLDLNSFQQALI